jgi:hypothetical protein
LLRKRAQRGICRNAAAHEYFGRFCHIRTSARRHDADRPPVQAVGIRRAAYLEIALREGLSLATLDESLLKAVEGEAKRNAVARWRVGERLPAAAIPRAARVDVLVESALLTSPAG